MIPWALRGATALILLGAILTAGCRSPSPSPIPSPSIRGTAAPLPSATATPLPTATPPPSATPWPTAVPTATAAPVIAGYTTDRPEPGCEIPGLPEIWTVKPAADAPPELQASWGRTVTPTLRAQVIGHDEANRRYQLKALEPAADSPFELIYSGQPLPLEVGREYRFRAHVEDPDEDPLGAGLIIEDADGVVFLGISARETRDADAQIFDGDRAGFGVRQLPTRCLYAPLNTCGYRLRAAPLEVKRADQTATLGAGQLGVLRTDPPYKVTVLTSHLRSWVGDVPCANPVDWVLSYRIERTTGDQG
jgi:hypothetical protein